jgi:hypothetical protein
LESIALSFSVQSRIHDYPGNTAEPGQIGEAGRDRWAVQLRFQVLFARLEQIARVTKSTSN